MSERLENSQTPESTRAETPEEAPEKAQTIAAFLEFARKHQGEITKVSREGLAELGGFFYENFYSADADAVTASENNSAKEEFSTRYKESMRTTGEKLAQDAQNDPRITGIENNEGWLRCCTNFENFRGAMGRFYLNVDPESAGYFFTKTVKTFSDAELNVEIKVESEINARALNRFDKMVIYFDSAEEAGAIRALENLCRDNRSVFKKEEIPRFAAAIKDEAGAIMPGIGFGEEPDRDFEGNSFGMIRARILAEVYDDARRAGLSVDSPRFNFETAFKKSCERWLVDPQHPAFNLSDNPEDFALLKERLGMKPKAQNNS